jgi:hypothetical protein
MKQGLGDMADKIRTNMDKPLENSQGPRLVATNPAWLRLMEYCAELGYGEIQSLKIQDGLPIVAEVTTRKVRFSP